MSTWVYVFDEFKPIDIDTSKLFELVEEDPLRLFEIIEDLLEGLRSYRGCEGLRYLLQS